MKYTIEIEVFDQSEDFLVNCEVHQFALQLAKKTHSLITAGFVMSSDEKQRYEQENILNAVIDSRDEMPAQEFKPFINFRKE